MRGRAEDGDFAALAVAFEDFEGVAKLFEGADHELHVAAAGVIVGEFEGGRGSFRRLVRDRWRCRRGRGGRRFSS